MADNATWEVPYVLVSAGDRKRIAQGHIKDYPSAEEALWRLGERLAAAVAGELRSVTDPAPWQLVLSFEVIRRGAPAEELRPRPGSSPATPRPEETPYPDKTAADLEDGIDLAAGALDDE